MSISVQQYDAFRAFYDSLYKYRVLHVASNNRSGLMQANKKEVMDVVAAQGDLLSCFMRSNDGTSAGSYESISHAAQRLIVEAEDLAHKIYSSEATATKLRIVSITGSTDIHKFLKGQSND